MAMYCPHCLNFINEAEPEFCPHCGQNLRKKKIKSKPIYKRWWFWVVAIFIAIYILGTIVPSGSAGREYYIVMAENIVSDLLKSPSTAEFCSSSEYKVAVADNLALVQGYVDSQNGFGAMIRNPFIVEMDVIDAKSFRCKTVYMQIGDTEYFDFVDADWKLLK